MGIEFEPLSAATETTVHGVDMASGSDSDIDDIRKGWMEGGASQRSAVSTHAAPRNE